MQRRDFLARLGLPALALAGCGGGAPWPDPGLPTPEPTHRVVGTLAVSSHAAVTAADGSVIVIGGGRGQAALSEAVDRFEPATLRLTRIATLSSGRESHRAVRSSDGRILVAGGITSLEMAPTAEIIDPLRGRWPVAGASFPRATAS